ncbi:unnamed protein product [Mytilus coruscus]|uniref:VWFC domain-containing protein n=1 Tax=Mytilus coruscus TaxID=42192 RepID=A0A6J8DGK7_MYTCO|nr:unnamed protein product [Mytilus coruscus]
MPDTVHVNKEFGNMIAIFIFMLVSISCVHATCNYHGTIHQLGSRFNAIDGCNTCVCEVHGISCTEIGCINPPAGGGCTYNGKLYKSGDSFPSTDKCNTCTCGSDGSVACKAHCSYQHHHYAIGVTWATLDGCNTCSCSLTGVTCTSNPCPTENSKQECHLNQHTYYIGATWTASDGCNLCSCTDTGVHCTNHHCQVAATCTYHGTIHHLGTRFDAIDGCNTCLCMEHGVACTEMACIKPSAGTCNYHRTIYNVGDSFNSTDGCNTCHCTSNGVSCTEMFCAVLHPTVQLSKHVRSSVYQIGFNCNYNGKQFNVGENWPTTDGCNTCSCHSGKLVVRMTCTENDCDSGKRSSVYQRGFHCKYEEKQFNVGESWTASDGCNTCICHAGDLLVRMTCTEKACAVGGQCTYHGKAYKVGDSFPSIDKCNTCFCEADGSVPCTERFCLLNENQG